MTATSDDREARHTHMISLIKEYIGAHGRPPEFDELNSAFKTRNGAWTALPSKTDLARLYSSDARSAYVLAMGEAGYGVSRPPEVTATSTEETPNPSPEEPKPPPPAPPPPPPTMPIIVPSMPQTPPKQRPREPKDPFAVVPLRPKRGWGDRT